MAHGLAAFFTPVSRLGAAVFFATDFFSITVTFPRRHACGGADKPWTSD
jgi:hypothetical protein